MAAPKRVRRVRRAYGLAQTYSGPVGETSVAAALLRFGFPVAKPMWGDDEWDLLVLDRDARWDIALPVQVKSRQDFQNQMSGSTTRTYVSGLLKSYVERSPGLCLAIYWPYTGGIWIIPGAKNIIRLYDRRLGQGSFAALANNANVGLRVATNNRVDLPPRYKVSARNAGGVPLLLKALARQLRDDLRERVRLESLAP